MLNELVASFLGISILFYCLFAGADFGAGILEIFRGKTLRREQTELMGHAIGPVWEANHVWLILAVVILFNGYPRAYGAISTYYHIPLTLMLLGIILRGCAFTFKHYDVVQDRSHFYYAAIFSISSLLTSFTLGTIAGATLLGGLPPSSSGFADTYVWPWCNGFCFSIGAFTCVLFTFLASVYLVGEATTPQLKKIFVQRARLSNLAAVICGALVFGSAQFQGFPLMSRFLADPMSCGCMLLATLILVPLWKCLRSRQANAARVLAASQVALILLGWFKLQFPVILAFPSGAGYPEAITIYNSAAGEETLSQLLYALVGGCFMIFPSLFFLMRIFKRTR